MILYNFDHGRSRGGSGGSVEPPKFFYDPSELPARILLAHALPARGLLIINHSFRAKAIKLWQARKCSAGTPSLRKFFQVAAPSFQVSC